MATDPADPASATAAYWAAHAAVADAKAQVKVSQQQLRAARVDLARAVVADYERGARVRDLAATTGLSREWVRQALRAAGVEPN